MPPEATQADVVSVSSGSATSSPRQDAPAAINSTAGSQEPSSTKDDHVNMDRRPDSLPPAPTPNGVPKTALPTVAGSASPALPTQNRPPPSTQPQYQAHPSPSLQQPPPAQGPLFTRFPVAPPRQSYPPPGGFPQGQGYWPPAPGPAPVHPPGPSQQHLPSSRSPPAAHGQPPNPNFANECTQLSQVLTKVSPEAVRRVLRDNWQKCLLGSDYHTAFIMNATIHHAAGGVLQRALRDFGGKMLQDGKVPIANHMTPTILDDVADILLAKVGDRFLDKAVAMRLPTMPAKTLLNSLARAERLGYDADDIEDEDDDEGAGQAATGPAQAPPPPHPPLQPPQAPSQMPPMPVPQQSMPVQHQQQQQQPRPMQGVPPTEESWARHTDQTAFPSCIYCGRRFESPETHAYHVKKSVCKKKPPQGKVFHDFCPRCGQGFTSPMGLQYHTNNKVCGEPTGAGHISTLAERPPPPNTSTVPPSSAPAAPRTPAGPTPAPVHVAAPPSTAPPPASSPDGIPLVQSDVPAYRPPVVPPITYPSTPVSQVPAQPPASEDINSSAHKAAAHLTPDQKASLDADMQWAEEALKLKIAEARTSWDPNDLERRLQSLKNSHATKQSQIRKRYGIRLRARRGPAAMAAERERLGLSGTPIRPSPQAATAYTMPAQQTPIPAPRPWVAANSPAGDVHGKRGREEASSPAHPPVKKLAVSEISGGLGDSAATAATQDPTARGGPGGGGYAGYQQAPPAPMNPSQAHYGGHARSGSGASVTRHVGSPQRISMGVAGRGVSREEPMDVDSSDSSSDSGSDIPGE